MIWESLQALPSKFRIWMPLTISTTATLGWASVAFPWSPAVGSLSYPLACLLRSDLNTVVRVILLSENWLRPLLCCRPFHGCLFQWARLWACELLHALATPYLSVLTSCFCPLTYACPFTVASFLSGRILPGRLVLDCPSLITPPLPSSLPAFLSVL